MEYYPCKTNRPQQSPPVRYWTMRLLRRMTPQRLVATMLDRGFYLRAGWDTSAPNVSLQLYEDAARQQGKTLRDSHVCILGYGGGFAVALHMLELGVRHVTLQDPYCERRNYRNGQLDPSRMAKFFDNDGSTWLPKDEYITVTREPMERIATTSSQVFDFVVSSSVLEHVSDLKSVIPACAQLTKPGGLNIHVVDLRDHYFKYPFEMLCYSTPTWERWLNASNNLNRWRLPQYRELFDGLFSRTDIDILESLEEDFYKVRHRIRPEFLTGIDQQDSVARIRVVARADN